MNLLLDTLKLMVLLPVIILLIYISFKYGGKYMGKMNNGKMIKVLERVPMGQNSYLAVISILGKPYVVSGGEKGSEILLELDESILSSNEVNSVLKSDTILTNLKSLNIIRRKEDK
jgi:flagellar protein FliO/FliZ